MVCEEHTPHLDLSSFNLLELMLLSAGRYCCWCRRAALALAVFAGSLSAQDTILVEGEAVDGTTRFPLEGVVIRLDGTDRATVTDELGYFRFEALSAGSYRIKATRLGYAEFEAVVELERRVVWSLELDAVPVTIEGVKVETERSSRPDPVLPYLRPTDVITEAEIDAMRDRVGMVLDVLRRKGPPRLQIRQQGGGGVWIRYCIESTRPAKGTFALYARPTGCSPAMIIVNGTVIFAPTGVGPADLSGRVAHEILEMDPEQIKSVTFLSPTDAHFRFGQAGQYGALIITLRTGR